MAVFAPAHNFVYKYIERRFDRRITENPADAPEGSAALLFTPVDARENSDILAFRQAASSKGMRVIKLSVPEVVGTGMTGLPMRLARGVARGTMLKIKDNISKWSLVHATDIAEVAYLVAQSDLLTPDFVIAAHPVEVNRFVEALGHRIKNKRVGSLAPRWAWILYGTELFEQLTSDRIVDTTLFSSAFPDFKFADPAEYLTTHNYDNDSL